jgi:hypothetical protein
MATQMPEVVPTAAGQEPPPRQKLLELSKEKCIGLWNCSVCAEGYNDTSDLAWTEEKPYTTQKTSENGELVCNSCIKGGFIKALPALATEFDHSFPAKWGTEELHINDFPEMFFARIEGSRRCEARRHGPGWSCPRQRLPALQRV